MAKGSFRIDVKGADKLAATFLGISMAARQQAKESVRKHSYEIEKGAKNNVPVDTGHLKRSISTKFYNGGMTGEVGTNVKYAPYVEYGTRRMRAQPYLFPAFLKARAAFTRDLGTFLTRLDK